MNFLRVFESKILRCQSSFNQLRAFTAQVEAKPANFNDEWNSAKKFEEIPQLSTIPFLMRFLPGGT